MKNTTGMEIMIEAGTGRQFDGEVNYMLTADRKVYAEVEVPENASEDYGYMAMKNAIAEAYTGTEPLEFWYDGCENRLNPDAYIACGVYLDAE